MQSMYVEPMRNSTVQDRIIKQALCRYELCPQAYGEIKIANPPPTFIEMRSLVEDERNKLEDLKTAILRQKQIEADLKKANKTKDKQDNNDDPKTGNMNKKNGGKRKYQSSEETLLDEETQQEYGTTDNDSETSSVRFVNHNTRSDLNFENRSYKVFRLVKIYDEFYFNILIFLDTILTVIRFCCWFIFVINKHW